MRTTTWFSYLPLLVLIAATTLRCSSPKPPGAVIPFDKVYAIGEKDGVIYFSTADRGIFKFKRETSGVVAIVAPSRAPFRALAFGGDTLFAVSYRRGLHRVVDRKLVRIMNGIMPAWSMKRASDGVIGLAGTHGVQLVKGDAVQLRIQVKDAQDIVFYDATLAVAHRRGISFYDRKTGVLIEKKYANINFWTATRHGDKVVYGGKGCVVIHQGKRWKKIDLPDKTDMPWSSALVGGRHLYVGAQKGLYKYDLFSGKFSRAGFRGECIKALFVDSKGKLWIGKFG